MWDLGAENAYRKAVKHFVKKYRRELKAVHDNLDTLLKALREGAKPQQVKLGCIHPEPGGVLAIDQKGGGAGLKETRLYTYPDEDTKSLYLITLGDKRSQKKDIQYCKEWVQDLLTKKWLEKEAENE